MAHGRPLPMTRSPGCARWTASAGNTPAASVATERPASALDRRRQRAENRARNRSLRDSWVAESTTIGPYRVLEPLGRGGMGIVYRARHTNSERPIALKTVDVPATKWIDSIRREIQALTRIRHPGIVRIVDHGVHKGRPWYAMDLVEGESLRRFVQRIWSPYRSWCPPVSSTEAATA